MSRIFQGTLEMYSCLITGRRTIEIKVCDYVDDKCEIIKNASLYGRNFYITFTDELPNCFTRNRPQDQQIDFKILMNIRKDCIQR